MCLALKDLHLYFMEMFARLISVVSENIYADHLEEKWTKGHWKYPKTKAGKKLSGKLLCVLLIHLTELHLSLQEAFR